jgi:hypothetical protein
MERMQAAASIGVPGYGNFAEGAVGGTLNRAQAIGAPLASVGMVAAGWDPFSVGIKAGLGAYRMGGGVLGAGAAGMAAAALPGAALMGTQYMAGQFLQGAQQQQQFNAQMRSSHVFNNSAGGQGFGRTDLGAIGSNMLQMTTQQGVGGEMVGFAELGRLAANMGRMGMTQGVRDAKEFTDKFKTMVRSLREIATEMGTSLEEAQKMMGTMRGSGIFGNRSASQFSSMIRNAAQAGGMATSEVTGMMNIGSQISRSMGGLGRAGARGGLETLANIGVAQQMGILSEEDIYNATGLTGAEGRRALATQQLGSSAQFLRGGLGRRFLASIAAKGGKLDAASVEEYMSGQVGTGRTMEMAHQNLGKVGRADFIRNEGRLRGEALGQFGGLAPAMVMKGWLEQRGIDVNQDTDKSMIFMQRRLGLGRDEADVMVKQVQNLPQLLRERRMSADEGQHAQRMALQQSHQGIQGLKHKLEKFRADVDSGLQKVGMDFYQETSEYVERYVNKLTGNYVKEFHRDVGRAFEEGLRGGAGGNALMARTIGKQGGGIFGFSGQGLGSAGGSDLANFRSMDAGRFREAGYNLGGVRSGKELQAGLNIAGNVSMAFQSGGSGLSGREGIASLGESAGGDIRRSMSLGSVKGKGVERLSSFTKLLDRLADDRGGEFGQLRDRYQRAGLEERAQIMATLTSSAGVEGEAGMFALPELMGIRGATQYATVGEKNAAVGKAIMGTEGSGRVMGFLKGLFGKRGPSEQEVTSTGAYFESDSGRDLAARALGTDPEGRRAAMKQVEKELLGLQQQGDLTDADRGRMNALQGITFARELGEVEGTEGFDDKVRQLMKDTGLSRGDVLSRASGAARAHDDQQERNRVEIAERFGTRARDQQSGMLRGGTLTKNQRTGQLELRRDLVGSASNIGAWSGDSSTAERFLLAMQEQQGALSGLGLAGQTSEERNNLLGRVQDASGRLGTESAAMSAKDKRALAGLLRGESGMGDVRSDLLAQAGIQERFDRAGKGGGAGTLAKMLGTSLDTATIKQVLSGRGAEGLTALLGEDLGLAAGGGAMKSLEAAVVAAQSGKSGVAAGAVRDLTGSDEFVQAQKKKQLQRAEDSDPLQAKANTLLENIGKTLTSLKDNSSLQLNALNKMNSTTENPEGKPG